jgi:hypothetical protein
MLRLVASLTDQLSVLLFPETTDDGLAEKLAITGALVVLEAVPVPLWHPGKIAASSIPAQPNDHCTVAAKLLRLGRRLFARAVRAPSEWSMIAACRLSMSYPSIPDRVLTGTRESMSWDCRVSCP